MVLTLGPNLKLHQCDDCGAVLCLCFGDGLRLNSIEEAGLAARRSQDGT